MSKIKVDYEVKGRVGAGPIMAAMERAGVEVAGMLEIIPDNDKRHFILKSVKDLYEYEINKVLQEAEVAVSLQKIEQAIENLGNMYDKYEELNRAANGKYSYRCEAIAKQLEVLELIIGGISVTEDWEKCYVEDLRDEQGE